MTPAIVAILRDKSIIAILLAGSVLIGLAIALRTGATHG
jgi:hypothetical protein